MILNASLALILAIGVPGPGDEPKAADGDAPIAEGFPAATRPDVIEVKNYPAYRSALARGPGLTEKGNGILFFPLFNHIKRKQIAMTAPVISTYSSTRLIESPGSRGEVVMEFVYRTPGTGEPGKDGAFVTVEDHPAATFLCLGVRGKIDGPRKKESLERLRAWLAEHRGDWVEAGPPRELGYHGPMTPEPERLWEFQIPVKPAPKPPK